MHWIEMLTGLTNRVLRQPGAYAWSIRTLQLLLVAAGGITAFLLRFEFVIPAAMTPSLWWGVAVWLAVKAPVFHFFGLGRGLWRYFSTPDLVRVGAANLTGSVLSAAVLLSSPLPFPRSVAVLDLALCLLLSAGVRAATRVLLEAPGERAAPQQRRTFIYGAGHAGAMLLRESRASRVLPHRICGFIDDDPAKTGLLVNGVPIHGRGEELGRLVQLHQITDVIIAIPSASGAHMTRIIQWCQQAGVAYRTMPAVSEMIGGRRLAAQIRDVAVEDVLGRGTVVLDHGRIQGKLGGKVALVTGAAGSIGAELCRQIARFQPAALVAYEISENGLFELEQEMKRAYPGLRFLPEIGSVQNVERLRDVFRRHAPAVVYHAAAYKHVPMMEAHPFEAVENNVIGTFNVATVAGDYSTDDFVMVSSDKAVRPTSVMGATKRVAELVVRSLQNGGPRYVSVRFGNVLGSNGSVVPIFKRQIAAGGPVTVTHPDMRRYFMTIPEAAQLVLQASTMGKGGEIFVLDMGQPLRITDLARQLIRLSGLRPDEDVRIEFTGIRPGEKLYEELNIDSEAILPTYHEKIKIFAGGSLPAAAAMSRLAAVRAACARRDLMALVAQLQEMVPDYTPSKELLQDMIHPELATLAAAVASGGGANPSLEPCPAAPRFSSEASVA